MKTSYPSKIFVWWIASFQLIETCTSLHEFHCAILTMETWIIIPWWGRAQTKPNGRNCSKNNFTECCLILVQGIFWDIDLSFFCFQLFFVSDTLKTVLLHFISFIRLSLFDVILKVFNTPGLLSGRKQHLRGGAR